MFQAYSACVSGVQCLCFRRTVLVFQAYGFMTFIVQFLVPFLVLVFCYSRIACALHKRAVKVKTRTASNTVSRNLEPIPRKIRKSRAKFVLSLMPKTESHNNCISNLRHTHPNRALFFVFVTGEKNKSREPWFLSLNHDPQ